MVKFEIEFENSFKFKYNYNTPGYPVCQIRKSSFLQFCKLCSSHGSEILCLLDEPAVFSLALFLSWFGDTLLIG